MKRLREIVIPSGIPPTESDTGPENANQHKVWGCPFFCPCASGRCHRCGCQWEVPRRGIEKRYEKSWSKRDAAENRATARRLRGGCDLGWARPSGTPISNDSFILFFLRIGKKGLDAGQSAERRGASNANNTEAKIDSAF